MLERPSETINVLFQELFANAIKLWIPTINAKIANQENLLTQPTQDVSEKSTLATLETHTWVLKHSHHVTNAYNAEPMRFQIQPELDVSKDHLLSVDAFQEEMQPVTDASHAEIMKLLIQIILVNALFNQHVKLLLLDFQEILLTVLNAEIAISH